MPAYTPEETHLEWTKAFHAGDLDGLVAMYEPGAAVMSAAGEEAVWNRPQFAKFSRAFWRSVQFLTCGLSEPYAAATSRSLIHAGL